MGLEQGRAGLRNALFARMLTLPARYYDDNNSSVLVSKVTHEVLGVTSAATGVLTVLVKDSLTVAGLLGWLVYLNWRLTTRDVHHRSGVAFVVKVFSKRMRSHEPGRLAGAGRVHACRAGNDQLPP